MTKPSSISATILVADDDEANLELLSGMLSAAGYDVLCASNGQEALSSVNQGLVDIALLDVIMPAGSGFSVCQQIKSNPQTRLLPVILVTGLSELDDRIHGIMCGADDFLRKPVSKHEVLARVHSLLQIKEFTSELENAEAVLFALAASIEAKDPYTEGHCQRLAEYSVALADRLGLGEEARTALRRAGVVHDIGKVAVPDHILLKSGPLTDEEWKIMKQHPLIGERICQPLKSFRLVTPIIRHHHERLDGSGYPDGLKGQQIPRTAQVLQTVDIYDALTTDRSYRRALPHEEALAIMRKEADRGWWDRSLIDELEVLCHQAKETDLIPAGGTEILLPRKNR
jgi:putative two-component system response regulator